MGRARQCNGIGKDEMIPSMIKKFCPKGSDSNGREKEEETCDLGSCDGKPDCPKYDSPCLDYAKKYERRQHRKKRRQRQRRRNHRRTRSAWFISASVLSTLIPKLPMRLCFK